MCGIKRRSQRKERMDLFQLVCSVQKDYETQVTLLTERRARIEHLNQELKKIKLDQDLMTLQLQHHTKSPFLSFHL